MVSEKIKKYKFRLIILDESQNIKNTNAQTTKAVMLLKEITESLFLELLLKIT